MDFGPFGAQKRPPRKGQKPKILASHCFRLFYGRIVKIKRPQDALPLFSHKSGPGKARDGPKRPKTAKSRKSNIFLNSFLPCDAPLAPCVLRQQQEPGDGPPCGGGTRRRTRRCRARPKRPRPRPRRPRTTDHGHVDHFCLFINLLIYCF